MELLFGDLSAEFHSVVFASIILFFVSVFFFAYLAYIYVKRKHARLPDEALINIDCAYFIEQGKRAAQQDSCFISPLEDYRKYGVVGCVADGMGGLKYGKEISEKVVNFVENMCPMSFFAPEQNADEFQRFSNVLYDEYKLEGGSTLALIQISGYYMNYYSVGDSNIILVRDGVATMLNPKQNYLAHLIKDCTLKNMQTNTVYTHPDSRSLVDFMGNYNPKVIYTKKPLRIYDGDKIIVSSDGLTDAVSLRTIPHHVKDSAKATARSLKSAVAIKKRMKQDNYTGIVITINRSPI